MAPKTRTGPLRVTEERRESVLEGILRWGDRHVDPKISVAAASNGRVYTENNLQYAVALLEQASITHKQSAPQRATPAVACAILGAIFPIGAEVVPLWLGVGSPALSPERIAAQILPPLYWLKAHQEDLPLDTRAREALERGVSLCERLLGADGNNEGSSPTLREVASAFHWTRLIHLDERATELHAHPCVTHGPLPVGRETLCWVDGYIRTYFYKGDFRGGQMVPVVLVGGWRPGSTEGGGAGFLCSSEYSRRERPSGEPSGVGNHPPLLPVLPPVPYLFWARAAPRRSFTDFGLGLMRAGYDCVRFAQTAPGDDISIAVKELALVVAETKKMYRCEKVILVGHSRGGLIARRYLVDKWNSDHELDVAKLITFGTPHLGASVGELLYVGTTGAIISALLGPTIAAMLLSLSYVPGFGEDLRDAMEHELLNLITSIFVPLKEKIEAFVESATQLLPTSDFIQTLNRDYLRELDQAEHRGVDFWNAVEHVLVGGTSPSYASIFVGSWLPSISIGNPEATLQAVYDAVAPQVCRKRISVFHHHVSIPYFCYRWRWRWHRILEVPPPQAVGQVGSMGANALVDGQGDLLVERRSALAEGASGKIRRGTFHLNHFALKSVDELSIGWIGPDGQSATVTPLQLVLTELGIPLDTVSQYAPPHDCS